MPKTRRVLGIFRFYHQKEIQMSDEHDEIPAAAREAFEQFMKVIKAMQPQEEDEAEDEEEPKVVGMIAKNESDGEFKFIIDRNRERVVRAKGFYCTYAGLWEDETPSQTSALAVVFDTDNPSPLKSGRGELVIVLDECMPSALFTILANMLPEKEAGAMSSLIIDMYNANMANDVLPMVAADGVNDGAVIGVIDGWESLQDHVAMVRRHQDEL